jgi:hypothetical protein
MKSVVGNIMSGKAPDKQQIDAYIQSSISHGDYETANSLRSSYEAYRGLQVFKGVSPSTAVTQIASKMNLNPQGPNSQLPNLDENFNAARTELGMSPQEESYYKYHLNNARTIGQGGGVANEDGSISTVRGVIQNVGGREYILPSVWGGQVHDNPKEIEQHAKQVGLDKFPNYGSVAEAEKREKAMHNYMEKDAQSISNWTKENQEHKLNDHSYHPEQQGKNLHLFGSRGMGVGAINAPFKGDLNQTLGGGISPNQGFTYLKSIGATDNEARMLVGASLSESNMNPNQTHDGGVGYGLFGHNMKRLDMRGKNAYQQYEAALKELRNRPESAAVNAAQSPYELAIAQMHFERPQGYTTANPQNGHNFTGRLNTLSRMYGLNGGQELPQVAAPQDMDTRPRPFTPQQLANDPILSATYNGILSEDAKQQVAYVNQTLPSMSEAVSRGIVPSTTEMASYIQLASQNPDNEQLQKNVMSLMDNVMAHPAAIAAAGMSDPQSYIDRAMAEAAGTGDINVLRRAEAMKKQVDAMSQEAKRDPQAYASRPDVNIIPANPPSVMDGLSQQDPITGLTNVRDMKNKAGIAITSRNGTPLLDNTIMKNDVAGVTNALLNSDGQSSTKILEAMQTVLPGDWLRHFEKDDKFRNALIGMTASNDVDKAKGAYNYLMARQEENPTAFDQNFKNMDKRIAFWRSNIAQMSPEEIIKKQNMLTDPSTQAFQKSMAETAKSEFRNINYNSVMASAGFVNNSLSRIGLAPSGDIGQRGFDLASPNQALMGPNDMSATPHLIGDFKQHYIEARQLNMDEASSTQYAIDKAKQSWGVSNLNGSRLMMFPPEKYYQADETGSYQWLTDDLRNTVADEVAKPDSPASKIPGLYWNPGDPNKPFNSLNPDVQVALHSDETTRMEIANPYRMQTRIRPDGTPESVEKKYPPSYGIVVKDVNGQWNALMTVNEKTGKLEPFRFRGDDDMRHQNAIDKYNSQRISNGLPGNMSLNNTVQQGGM